MSARGCSVGFPGAPCGKAAVSAIAVAEVADNTLGDNVRDGGVILLCVDHDQPVSDWPKD